jgi:hypothetical protein
MLIVLAALAAIYIPIPSIENMDVTHHPQKPK